MEIRSWDEILESEVFTEEELVEHITDYDEYRIFCDRQGIDELHNIYSGESVLEIALERIYAYSSDHHHYSSERVVAWIADIIEDLSYIDSDLMYIDLDEDYCYELVDDNIGYVLDELIYELTNKGYIVDSIEVDNCEDEEYHDATDGEYDTEEDEEIIEITKESLMDLFTA